MSVFAVAGADRCDGNGVHFAGNGRVRGSIRASASSVKQLGPSIL